MVKWMALKSYFSNNMDSIMLSEQKCNFEGVKGED